MSRKWNAEDRIQRAIGFLETALEDIEEMKGSTERSRKKEIEDFFEKLDMVRCPFSYEGTDGIMSVHLQEGAENNSDEIVIIAISREKARNVL